MYSYNMYILCTTFCAIVFRNITGYNSHFIYLCKVHKIWGTTQQQTLIADYRDNLVCTYLLEWVQIQKFKTSSNLDNRNLS